MWRRRWRFSAGMKGVTDESGKEDGKKIEKKIGRGRKNISMKATGGQ
jgi:hypothetical protein